MTFMITVYEYNQLSSRWFVVLFFIVRWHSWYSLRCYCTTVRILLNVRLSVDPLTNHFPTIQYVFVLGYLQYNRWRIFGFEQTTNKFHSTTLNLRAGILDPTKHPSVDHGRTDRTTEAQYSAHGDTRRGKDVHCGSAR